MAIKSYRHALVLFALVTAVAGAQILNSERIEQTFGSYGIDVAYSDATLRISDLFSRDDGRKTTRTLAIVAFVAAIDPAFAAVHERVLDGGSIGATFQAAGWQVGKRNLEIRQTPLPKSFAAAMQLEPGTPLATHIYQLEISKDGRTYPYATIVEMHHPDYLTSTELAAIYSLVPAPALADVVTALEVLLRGLAQLERMAPAD